MILKFYYLFVVPSISFIKFCVCRNVGRSPSIIIILWASDWPSYANAWDVGVICTWPVSCGSELIERHGSGGDAEEGEDIQQGEYTAKERDDDHCEIRSFDLDVQPAPVSLPGMRWFYLHLTCSQTQPEHHHSVGQIILRRATSFSLLNTAIKYFSD